MGAGDKLNAWDYRSRRKCFALVPRGTNLVLEGHGAKHFVYADSIRV